MTTIKSQQCIKTVEDNPLFIIQETVKKVNRDVLGTTSAARVHPALLCFEPLSTLYPYSNKSQQPSRRPHKYTAHTKRIYNGENSR
jgi:hypothetical protein